MTRRHSGLVVAGLVVTTALAACGGGGGGSGGAAAKGSDVVSVTLSDYGFDVSGPLKAGGTIKLRNVGKEFHMMGLGRLKPGKTLDDVKAALAKVPPGGPGSEQEDPTKDVVDTEIGAPGTFMGPGQSAEVTAPALAPGTYALVCFVPMEGGGPPHFTKGMISQLSVVDEKAPAPKADATYTIAPGKPVEGPATLTAGRHVIEIKASPGSDQLEPGLIKLDEGKTLADATRVFKSFETGDDFVLPPGAAAKVPAKVVAGLLDVNDQKVIYLGVDLQPGTYAIDASDTDVENAPDDPVEQATIIVR